MVHHYSRKNKLIHIKRNIFLRNAPLNVAVTCYTENTDSISPSGESGCQINQGLNLSGDRKTNPVNPVWNKKRIILWASRSLGVTVPNEKEERDPENPANPVNHDVVSLAEKTIEDVLLYFGEETEEARKKYRQFVKDGIERGTRPELQGGGLIRSQGGDKSILFGLGSEEREESDQRILGSGDYACPVKQLHQC